MLTTEVPSPPLFPTISEDLLISSHRCELASCLRLVTHFRSHLGSVFGERSASRSVTTRGCPKPGFRQRDQTRLITPTQFATGVRNPFQPPNQIRRVQNARHDPRGLVEHRVGCYEASSRELHVRFLGQRTYIYSDVPAELHDELMSAPSKGSFLNRVIKSAYAYREL